MRIGALDRALDAAFKEIKDQITQNVTTKLLLYAEKIDAFDKHFQLIGSMV